jgi:hypothetical protein
MTETIQKKLTEQTKLPSKNVRAFLETFSCGLLKAADKGHAKTPLFRLTKLNKSGYKPSMNPCSRLKSAVSLMPIDKSFVSMLVTVNKLPLMEVQTLLTAMMDDAKISLTKGGGVYIIPNTVKMEVKQEQIRITSLGGIKHGYHP